MAKLKAVRHKSKETQADVSLIVAEYDDRLRSFRDQRLSMFEKDMQQQQVLPGSLFDSRHKILFEHQAQQLSFALHRDRRPFSTEPHRHGEYFVP
jgi:hypothetical protein